MMKIFPIRSRCGSQIVSEPQAYVKMTWRTKGTDYTWRISIFRQRNGRRTCNTSILWQTLQGRSAATDRSLFVGWCCSRKLLDSTACLLTGWLLMSSNWQPGAGAAAGRGSQVARLPRAEPRALSPGGTHGCTAASAPLNPSFCSP